jgi:hypothetical protein
MRKYTDMEERRVRRRAQVREWVRSELLSASQAERLARELDVDFRRTNAYLRATLAFFTLLIVVGLVGVPASAFNIHREMPSRTRPRWRRSFASLLPKCWPALSACIGSALRRCWLPAAWHS